MVDGEREDAGTAAFAAAYRDHHDAIVRVAYLVVRSRAVAEELAQEAFLRLYAHRATVTNPAGFLRTTVVRLAITWSRRHAMEGERLRLLDRPATAEAAEPDEVWEAIGRLAPDRAAVLVLRFYADLSHRDIGRALGCPPATARSRLRRALADLRQELDP